MSRTGPTLVFIPGSWHKPICYTKIIEALQDEHQIKCVSITLPSTTDNPNATFKDDIDIARSAILAETVQGRDVIVVAHSYGGMVGNSAIKGLTLPKFQHSTTTTTAPSQLAQTVFEGATASQIQTPQSRPSPGHVTALILIASGFTITGLSFMDPLLGIPPPSWRIDKPSGYATLVANPAQLFYHDLPPNEADYWVSQLTTQSLKSLFEGGEHAYAGWQDVPTRYIGTIEDRGLPVLLQRVQVGMARGQGAVVHHVELQSSHSPFLSRPGEVAEVIMEAVRAVSGIQGEILTEGNENKLSRSKTSQMVPMVRLIAPSTWFKYGMPFLIGRALGVAFRGFMCLRALWTGK